MPVLQREPNIWPDGLFSELAERSMDALPWWVLHTRPRTEKQVARLLLRADVSFFLPLYERTRQIQRRTVRSHLPLFPGYVFLRGGDDARQAALQTNLLANCLKVHDQEQLAEDLVRTYKLLASGARVTPESRLQPGMPAEIIRGPLAGCRGRVLRCGSGMRFVIEVIFLHQGASVEVEAHMVQPL